MDHTPNGSQFFLDLCNPLALVRNAAWQADGRFVVEWYVVNKFKLLSTCTKWVHVCTRAPVLLVTQTTSMSTRINKYIYSCACSLKWNNNSYYWSGNTVKSKPDKQMIWNSHLTYSDVSAYKLHTKEVCGLYGPFRMLGFWYDLLSGYFLQYLFKYCHKNE